MRRLLYFPGCRSSTIEYYQMQLMPARKRSVFQIPGFRRGEMAQTSPQRIPCEDAVALLDSLDRIHARAPYVTAPETCAAGATLEAIPRLMRPGKSRADRARLLHAYLRAVRADARRIPSQRAASMALRGNWRAWLESSFQLARMRFWFGALHACGWLYRARIPMYGAFAFACRALAATLAKAYAP
jgi:hypothetical protein